MGYWVKPGYLPEAIDIPDFASAESEISGELTRIARTVIMQRSLVQPGPVRHNEGRRPAVEIPDRTFADEDSIVAGFSERPTDISTPAVEDTQERTRVDPGLAAAVRKAGRLARGGLRVGVRPLPTTFAPAPRGIRPPHAEPPQPTVLPANSLASPEVQWDPTADIDRSMVTADLELDLELDPVDHSHTPAERWPGRWPEPAPAPPVNHSRPAPLQLPERSGRRAGLPRSLGWVVWLGVLVAAGLGLFMGVAASLLFFV